MDISTKELPQAITEVLYSRLVPFISGSPGIAKSDIVKQVAKDLNLELIDVRLSQMDPTEIQGFPSIKDNKTIYVPPKVFPIKGDPLPFGKDGFLILLDEMSSASLAVQAAAYRLVLDRQVGQYDLHPNVAIVAAGNLASDKAIVNRMSTAMQSRMVHFNLKVNHKDWLDWANTENLDSRITSFIEFRPQLLHNFNPNHSDNTFPCPRTWHMVHKLIHNKDTLSTLDTKIIAGTVGEGAAREFKAYTEIYESLPNIHSIVKDPMNVSYRDQPDILYALTGLVSSNVNKDNAEALTKFIGRLPLEFQIITWITAIKRDKTLNNLPSIKKWVTENAQKVLM
jgi:hypothetical protein